MSKPPRRRRVKRSNIDLATMPAEFYRFSYVSAINAPGKREIIPELISTLIPYSVVKSLSLVIDPFHKFKISGMKITPTNRVRLRSQNSVLLSRSYTRNNRQSTKSVVLTGGCVAVPIESSSSTSSVTQLIAQSPVVSRTADTTSRTRPYLSEQGEFEHFTVLINSPPRSIRFQTKSKTYLQHVGCQSHNWSSSELWRSYTTNGQGARLSSTSIDDIRASDSVALLNIMQKQAVGLLKKALPERRHMTVFRSVAELKDLPRSILQLRKTLQDLITISAVMGPKISAIVFSLKSNLNNVPKEWLGYHFAWKQMYEDLVKLMTAPERVTKEIDRLIVQRGKPITTRFNAKWALDSVSTPSFTYDNFPDESLPVVSSNRTREITLRIMTSAVFDFPPTGIPTFQSRAWYEKLGVVPRLTDFYHLTPWTWLYDWFTGLGDYVDAFDAINTDRSTINFGFLTGTLTSRLTTTRTSRTVSTDDWQYLPGSSGSTVTNNPFSHSSIAECKTTIRKDIGANYGVKSISTGQGLSLYQLSILGALLATRRGLKS